jgi:hypothetical protein
MKFTLGIVLALGISISAFIATGHNPTSAGPSTDFSQLDGPFACRPLFRIFYCETRTTRTITTIDENQESLKGLR